MLGGFWLGHEHLFGLVARLDDGFVVLNLATLLGIVFVPFASAFAADYGTERIAVLLFALNLAGIGLLYVLQIAYVARHPCLLHAPLSAAETRMEIARALSTPAAALVAVLVSFAAPSLSYLAYLLVPAFQAVTNHMWSR